LKLDVVVVAEAMVVARKHNLVVMVDTHRLDRKQAEFVDCNKLDPYLYELDDVLVNWQVEME
jgi:hypothetical protein